ncbi:hypothetical protein BC343_04385 [Mucilaginibacter pedocola]|uniref:Thioredoxin domain-containing protein n=2 Tax=Mucilaginibacter pedocola TaxID=1792845 RepID=A0A1S9PG43_9SPHI|nr:hypothetical protein BC343_04385 [Mucilaginibacter pedocola]
MANAQKSKAPWPAFRIGLPDATYYSGQDLKPKGRVLFIYFSPDCEDCQQFTQALVKQADRLKKYRVIMVTNTALPPVIAFREKYGLKKYPNITVGTEGSTYVLQRAFNVQRFPFAAMYAGGKLVKTFGGEAVAMAREVADMVQKN